MTKFHFSFKSHFDGQSDFECYNRETRETSRICLSADGAARCLGREIPGDVLEAFNTYRQAKHASDAAEIASKYGDVISAFVPAFAAAL